MRQQPQSPPPGNRATAEPPMQELLHDAFRELPVATAGFRTAVWSRIEARNNPATWAQWLRGHLAGVSVAMAACVLLAATGGGLLAWQQNRSQRQEQILLYLSSIDAHRHIAAQADAHSPATGQTTLRQ